MKEQLKKPWLAQVEPFCIFGNLYYVGTSLVCTHLIDTGSGLILMDPGYPQLLYLVIHNICTLGFSVKDIRYIVCTHGHYDHIGAARALRELCGGKICLGAADREYANGTVDLTWARELGCEYNEAFEPDILLHPNDTLRLGNTEILVRAAAGHTPGTLAFFFPVTDGKTTLRAGMHGGVGRNSMKKAFLDTYGLSYSIREQFPIHLEELKSEHVDIHLGNHEQDNHTLEKAARLHADHNPFIDDTEWEQFLEEKKKSYFELLSEEA